MQALASSDVRVSTASVTKLGCKVAGEVVTRGDGAPEGLARFELNLPPAWNRKFLFLGGAGLDGVVPDAPALLLSRGYAILATDSGHVGRGPSPTMDGAWVRGPEGRPDLAKRTDYAVRARRSVNAAVRPMVTRFYDAPVGRAYFIGCSGGGREALIEAERNYGAYDGIIAGDPWADYRSVFSGAAAYASLLKAPIAYDQLPALEAAILADCDAEDGVTDGLIQNPAACRLGTQRLVARRVVTLAQAKALDGYFAQLRDTRGRLVGYGGAVAGLGVFSPAPAGVPGGVSGLSAFLAKTPPSQDRQAPFGALADSPVNWQLVRAALGGLGFNDPMYPVLGPALFDAHGRIQATAVDHIDRTMRDITVHPEAMKGFFRSKTKLLIYVGTADAITPAYYTEGVYRRMARTAGGLTEARAHARLFVAPDMQHCGGGSGPNIFDPLTAIEAWVEGGAAPDAIIATKFEGDSFMRPVKRRMPLCAYPEMAIYSGKGDPNTAEAWRCEATDTRMLDIGPAGARAGAGQDIDRPSLMP